MKPAGPAGNLPRERIARDLSQLIEGDVRFSEHERLLYATDASIFQVEPIGVVCPRHAADVERIVAYCAEHKLPILPRGGGTSLAGQTVNRAIVIDFSVLCRDLIEVDAAKRTARVQPGMVLDLLNAALVPHGLLFGPDVASGWSANIGGMIGNNSAGARSIVYGRTVEHLLGLDVILAGGQRIYLDEGAAERDKCVREITHSVVNIIRSRQAEIEQRFPKTIRHVNGYNLDLILKQLRASTPGTFDRVNLAHLVCGSEGTLAVTIEATLNLVPVPKCVGLAIVGFATVEDALLALTRVLETKPSAVELIDDVVISLAKQNAECCSYVDLLPKAVGAEGAGAVLYVEYCGDDPRAVQERFDELQSRFAAHMINRYTKPAEMAQAWKLRRSGEPLLHGLAGARKPITFIEDLAVDPHRLADFVADFRTIVAKHGTTAAYYAHASVGCLHIRPLVNPRDGGDVQRMHAIAEEATDLVLKYHGALSGEHGDGRLRSHLLERFYGREICDAFRAIKKIFDPENRFNPGNIVDPAPNAMTEHMRVKPLEQMIEVPRIKTFFRYQQEHGFGEAVERCNGAGVCRKMKGGTMCPSYRATFDERHATRGRGNALRLAITGQFSGPPNQPLWNDPETLKTLDLCLSCKACKTECPSNVDVAKLKAEYLAQSYAQSGRVPFSTRAFANVRSLNRIGSAIHPIANLLAALPPLKALAHRLMGLHSRRSLPRFERSLYRWMDQHEQRDSHLHNHVRMSATTPPGDAAALKPDRPTVILFPDCFTLYNEPRIGRAAILTLEKLGYRVVLPMLDDYGGGCCGRSSISTGMLAKARGLCAATARSLINCMQRENAIAIVGCEPSCVSAIKDDWLDLDMDISTDELRHLAKRTFLVEQFIEAQWENHPQSPAIPVPATGQTASAPVLLHAHCHQKALWGADTSALILRRLLGDRLSVLDSGCCGMAGAFGYTREHYDISMRIGELSLFGAIRQSQDAIIVAPGASCRQQIHDGVNRRAALHPIELIAKVMGAQ